MHPVQEATPLGFSVPGSLNSTKGGVLWTLLLRIGASWHILYVKLMFSKG